MANDSFGNYVLDLKDTSIQNATTPGSGAVFRNNGNPNGAITTTGPAFCIDVSTTPNTIWIKNTAGTSNSEWVVFAGL